MHHIPPLLAERLKRSPFPPAALWTITRKDGVTLRFTDAPRDMKAEGLRYKALAAVTPSETIERDDRSRRFAAALSHDALSEADLLNGAYDEAAVTLAYTAFDAPQTGAALVFRGTLGNVTVQDGIFTADVISPEERLNQSVSVETYSPRCRAQFGDARCGVNAEALGHGAALTWTDASRLRFTLTPAPADPARFAGGTAGMLTGAATGEILPVATATASGEFLLAAAPKRAIASGDTLTLIPGCDKRPETCRARYANMINFRGEPGLPGAAFFGT